MDLIYSIARRELGSLFRTPAGWVVIALYLFLSASVFCLIILVPGRPASLREFFGLSGWLLLPVVPAISMRLISEELRAGTIEPLMTAPVPDSALVLGKYAGACSFLLLMLAPTLVFPIVLLLFSDPTPDLGPIITGYLSLVLQGALFLGIGLLASAMTSNQTLAFLLTLFTILALLMVSAVSLDRVPEWAHLLCRGLSVEDRVRDLARGILDLSHLAFFLGGAAFFVTLATIVLQSRRWR